VRFTFLRGFKGEKAVIMEKRYRVGSELPDFNFLTPWEGEKNFYSVSGGKKKALYFLRYYGCSLTQLEFRRIASACAAFGEKGAQVYVAVQSAAETMRAGVKREDVPFEIICDPEGSLYRLLDIGYLHYGFFMRGIPANLPPRQKKYEEEVARQVAEARALGISHGLYEGCEQQLPAVFVADEKQKLTFVHYSEDLVDIPDAGQLLSYI
jgi:peroxiredoxin